jgi:phage N-6-adenine-methyltransferase
VSVVGYRARNHPQQVRASGAVAEVDDRATDWEDFRPLNARFGFTIDAAASPRNAKLPRYWTAAVNGLEQSWAGERVWCNPPYSHPNLYHWVTKAWRELGTQPGPPELVVMLVPANRTEQVWWQQWVEPFRDRAGEILHVEFLPGRMRFVAPGANGIGPNERPPFGCCLLIWGHDVPPALPVATQADLFSGEAS